MAFKMKGSPMKRNFGVGGSSPMTMKGTSPLKQELTEAQKLENEKFKKENPVSEGGVYIGNIEGEEIPQNIIDRANKLEKEMQANRNNADELWKTLEDYAQINMKLEFDEEQGKEIMKWTSKDAYNTYTENYEIYKGLTDTDADLIKKINQAYVVDYPAAISDSTQQAGQRFFGND